MVYKAFLSALSVCSICLTHQKHQRKAQVTGRVTLLLPRFPNRGGKKLRKIQWTAQDDTSSKWQHVTQSSSISDIWPSIGTVFPDLKELPRDILRLGRWSDSTAQSS